MLRDRTPDRPPATIQVSTGDEPMLMRIAGSVEVMPGTADDADATISGPPDAVIEVLRGRLDLTKAKRRGVRFKGRREALERLTSAEAPA
jgi:hypothetical protein